MSGVIPDMPDALRRRTDDAWIRYIAHNSKSAGHIWRDEWRGSEQERVRLRIRTGRATDEEIDKAISQARRDGDFIAAKSILAEEERGVLDSSRIRELDSFLLHRWDTARETPALLWFTVHHLTDYLSHLSGNDDLEVATIQMRLSRLKLSSATKIKIPLTVRDGKALVGTPYRVGHTNRFSGTHLHHSAPFGSSAPCHVS